MTELKGLTSRSKKITAVDVKRVPGKAIEVPEEITLRDAIDILTRTLEYEDQVVDVREEIDCFPLDGALALRRAVEETFGVALSEAQMVQTFFGPMMSTAKELRIAVGPDEYKSAPWGQYPLLIKDRIQVPDPRYAVDWIQPNYKHDENTGAILDKFVIYGKVRRKYEPLVAKIANRVRELIRTESIYRGKAIRIRFVDEDGERIPLPNPIFLDTRKTDPSRIVFSRMIEEVVSTNVLGPIVARDACREAGIPFKRGVILAGPFGTGKTLLAETIAKHAVENGITFLYLEDVREFSHGWKFARQYAPCVIFGEDLDRAFDGDERTVEVDRILNTIDGVDSKSVEIMSILTTNEIEEINRAMLRPGRIDVIVDVQPPDAEAAARLVRTYLGDMLHEDTDLTGVGAALDGQIPALIREACERSKLATIARTKRKPKIGDITARDILIAAETMRQQAELLREQAVDERSPIEKAADRLGSHIRAASAESRDASMGLPPLGPLPRTVDVTAATLALTSGDEVVVNGHGSSGDIAD